MGSKAPRTPDTSPPPPRKTLAELAAEAKARPAEGGAPAGTPADVTAPPAAPDVEARRAAIDARRKAAAERLKSTVDGDSAGEAAPAPGAAVDDTKLEGGNPADTGNAKPVDTKPKKGSGRGKKGGGSKKPAADEGDGGGEKKSGKKTDVEKAVARAVKEALKKERAAAALQAQKDATRARAGVAAEDAGELPPTPGSPPSDTPAAPRDGGATPPVAESKTPGWGFDPVRGPGRIIPASAGLIGRLLKFGYRQAPNIIANAVAIPAVGAATGGAIYGGIAGTMAAYRGIQDLLDGDDDNPAKPTTPMPAATAPADPVAPAPMTLPAPGKPAMSPGEEFRQGAFGNQTSGAAYPPSRSNELLARLIARRNA